eukprot:7940928-Alexandrium_andersonii.AAC.1
MADALAVRASQRASLPDHVVRAVRALDKRAWEIRSRLVQINLEVAKTASPRPRDTFQKGEREGRLPK